MASHAERPVSVPSIIIETWAVPGGRARTDRVGKQLLGPGPDAATERTAPTSPGDRGHVFGVGSMESPVRWGARGADRVLGGLPNIETRASLVG